MVQIKVILDTTKIDVDPDISYKPQEIRRLELEENSNTFAVLSKNVNEYYKSIKNTYICGKIRLFWKDEIGDQVAINDAKEYNNALIIHNKICEGSTMEIYAFLKDKKVNENKFKFLTVFKNQQSKKNAIFCLSLVTSFFFFHLFNKLNFDSNKIRIKAHLSHLIRIKHHHSTNYHHSTKFRIFDISELKNSNGAQMLSQINQEIQSSDYYLENLKNGFELYYEDGNGDLIDIFRDKDLTIALDILKIINEEKILNIYVYPKKKL